MRNIKPFIFGILAASGALVLELIISNLYLIISGKNIEINYFNQITFFLVLVVLIEEFFKYILLFIFYREQAHTNRTISSALIAGLGFASVELFFSYLNIFFNQDTFYFDLGIIGILFLHIATTGIIGYLILLRKKRTLASSIKIIIISSCLHITYNLMIIYNMTYLMICAYLLAIFLMLFIFSHTKMPDEA